MGATSLEFSILRTAKASAYARMVSHEVMRPKSTTLTVPDPRHQLHTRVCFLSPRRLAAGNLPYLVSQLGLETTQLGREHSLRVVPGLLPDKVLGGLILAHGSLPICPGL